MGRYSKVLKVLTEARAYLSVKQHWAKFFYAQDSRGGILKEPDMFLPDALNEYVYEALDEYVCDNMTRGCLVGSLTRAVSPRLLLSNDVQGALVQDENYDAEIARLLASAPGVGRLFLTSRRNLLELLMDFNDNAYTNHDDVLAALDWAIARAKELHALDVLRETRAWLSDPQHWIQDSWALGKLNEDPAVSVAVDFLYHTVLTDESCDVFVTNHTCQTCLLGGILLTDTPEVLCSDSWYYPDKVPAEVVTSLLNTPTLHGFLGSGGYLYRAQPARDIMSFNDSERTTHEDVLRALDEAIGQLEAIHEKA